jgi:phage-related minor tail protein
MAGTTYLVGERGPELFMPQTSGNVVANNKLGGGTSISVPIGNIDGGSKQLLANLPNMIENLVLEAMRRYA